MITYDGEDDVYNVSFPDRPGCFTFGGTLEEAQANATEALSAYLESIDSRRLRVPKPSVRQGQGVFRIEPDRKVGFAIWLKKQREARGLSQSDVARKNSGSLSDLSADRGSREIQSNAEDHPEVGGGVQPSVGSCGLSAVGEAMGALPRPPAR